MEEVRFGQSFVDRSEIIYPGGLASPSSESMALRCMGTSQFRPGFRAMLCESAVMVLIPLSLEPLGPP
jgi:hypothetical protein